VCSLPSPALCRRASSAIVRSRDAFISPAAPGAGNRGRAWCRWCRWCRFPCPNGRKLLADASSPRHPLITCRDENALATLRISNIQPLNMSLDACYARCLHGPHEAPDIGKRLGLDTWASAFQSGELAGMGIH
jgi:hypothetical protein